MTAEERQSAAVVWRAREITALTLATAALVMAIPTSPFAIILGAGTGFYVMIRLLQRPPRVRLLVASLILALVAIGVAAVHWAYFFHG